MIKLIASALLLTSIYPGGQEFPMAPGIGQSTAASMTYVDQPPFSSDYSEVLAGYRAAADISYYVFGKGNSDMGRLYRVESGNWKLILTLPHVANRNIPFKFADINGELFLYGPNGWIVRIDGDQASFYDIVKGIVPITPNGPEYSAETCNGVDDNNSDDDGVSIDEGCDVNAVEAIFKTNTGLIRALVRKSTSSYHYRTYFTLEASHWRKEKFASPFDSYHYTFSTMINGGLVGISRDENLILTLDGETATEIKAPISLGQTPSIWALSPNNIWIRPHSNGGAALYNFDGSKWFAQPLQLQRNPIAIFDISSPIIIDGWNIYRLEGGVWHQTRKDQEMGSWWWFYPPLLKFGDEIEFTIRKDQVSYGRYRFK